MIIREHEIVIDHDDANNNIDRDYVDGYFLTIHDLIKLVRDFQVDCHDGFVSNDKAYLEQWLKKHERIVKK
jgi:hypothetical protein